MNVKQNKQPEDKVKKMLLRQPSPSVDSRGVCVSYQEMYWCIMVSGTWCRALECANDNKKGYFCLSFFFSLS